MRFATSVFLLKCLLYYRHVPCYIQMSKQNSKKVLSRRQVLGSLGCAAGSVAAGCATALSQRAVANEPAQSDDADWSYRKLDPDQVADLAHTLYFEGSCMYAVFSSIILGLADQVGEPFNSFPRKMMRYGHGGVAGWGTICGALNGAVAAFGLFTPDKKTSDRLADGLLQWYRDTPLPRYVPKDADPVEMPRSVADSVLCHISTLRWREEAERPNIKDPLRKARCARLTADTAKKTVEILNAYVESQELPAPLEVTPPSGLSNDGSTKMNCDLCH